MSDIHTDGNISATGNITTTNSNLQAPQGSIYVQANVVAAGQMFADGNIYGNASLFVTNANISGALAVDSIATDVYTYANGAPVPLNGLGYDNSNVAAFLPTYTGTLAATNIQLSNTSVTLGANVGSGVQLVAIGANAAASGAGSGVVAIGNAAGQTNAGANAVYIGNGAGATHGVTSGENMVAIGAGAGGFSQGSNAVAVGYLAGDTNQANNSIVLNATGSSLSAGYSGTFVSPIRADNPNVTNGLYYNFTTKEILIGPNPINNGPNGIYNNEDVQLFLNSGTLAGNIIPGSDNLYTLGNITNEWADIYTKSNVVIKGQSLGVDAGSNLTYNTLPVIVGDANGNVTAPYFFGDGSGLTNTYGNANVELYLPDYTGDLPSVGNIVASGDITAANFIGNGAQLTGMYGDANVETYLPTYTGNLGNVTSIVATANISATNLTITGESNLGAVTGVVITGGNVGEVLTTNGSGDLTWQAVDLNIVPPVYLTAPIAGNNQVFSNTILASYNSNVEMTVFYNGALLENTNYTLNGDEITVNIPLAVGDGIDVVTTIASSVNSIVSSGYGNSNVAAYLPSYTGSLPSLTGNVSTVANVQAAYFIGNGSQLTGLPAGYANSDAADYLASNANVTITTTGNITAPTVTAGNLKLTGDVLSSTGDMTIDPLNDGLPIGNVTIAGNLTVTGNITYNDIVNATTNDLQWIAANNAASPALATGGGLAVGPSGSYATFTYNAGSNVWQSSLPLLANGGVNANGALVATTGSFSDNVTSTGVINGGSFIAGNTANPTAARTRIVPASSNTYIQTGNGTAGSTGNVVFSAWQDSAPKVIINTATGNLTANYFIGNGSQLTGLPAGYTNANVATYLASNANVVITTTGNITSTGTIVANTIGNAATFLYGDGSNIAGLPAPYTDTDVSLYLASGSDTAGFETTGNVTANVYYGNGSQLTGIFTTQASFAKYKRTTAQTGIAANSAVICNVAEALSGSDISVNTTTGSITLQAGKTYRLRGTVGDATRISAGPCYLNFQWFNVTSNSLIGTDTYYVSPSSSSNELYYGGTTEVIFTPTVTTVVQLRITVVSNVNTIGSSAIADSFPWIDIEVIGGATPLTSAPAFSATSSVSTVITTAFTDTLVAYNNEIFDPDGWFASNRYTPQRAGWYQISCGARLYVPASGQTNERALLLRKTGTDIAVSGGYGAITGTISQLVYLNGTTDYVDVAITSANTGTVPQSTSQTYFNGFWVRA
jgi:hypothetical protein